jgi:hypothetical protein
MIITGPDKNSIEKLKSAHKKEYQMKDVRNVSKYLGLDIVQSKDKESIRVRQKTYIRSVLKTFGFENCNPVSTPMEPGIVLQESEEGIDEELQQKYQRAIGSLMYLMVQTRPDISYAVSTLAQYSSNPTKRTGQE